MGQRTTRSIACCAAVFTFIFMGAALAADAPSRPLPATPIGAVSDFDSQHGRWRTTVRRLAKPLSGSQEWVEYAGTSVVHPMLGGRANVVELDVSGASGRIEGLAFRLFDAGARQWVIHFSGAGSGSIEPPVRGGFGGGRQGVFYGTETFKGRPILVRFTIDATDATTLRFEQAFSADGGSSWEPNWIATDRRMN